METEVINKKFKAESIWEVDVLPNLAKKSELNSYFHNGFWQPMDTLRDKKLLENLWNNGDAPWKTWA